MGRLIAALYERVTAPSETACLRDWRAELLRDLDGDVLEVGAGTGHNVPHYGSHVRRLVLTEPDRHMRRRLWRRVRAMRSSRIEVVDASLDALPFEAAAFDAVVATLVLCSVPSPPRALDEIRRVLRPDGRFLFIEHVAAEEHPRRLAWQRRIEPFWKRVSGNCHLTRRTADAIAAARFAIVEMRHEGLCSTFAPMLPTIRGIARKA